MACPELAHLELLADLDALTQTLQHWGDGAPVWQPAIPCRALVRRLAERVGSMRVRLEAPLIVATLGGTGTGKSALVSALVGAEVTEVGRSRPTTHRPALVCRPELSAQVLGIDPQAVELVQRDLPALADLVLVDCPDPDTSESPEMRDSNLARLRQILPHCDVLLVTATQQKYRSARVAEELAAAASGARLVFVQTHAGVDEDIRDDWRTVLGDHYATGHIFLVDSLSALADAEKGLEPQGEFAGLVDLLTRQLAGSAAARIRRANFLDLVDDTLAACRRRIEQGMPAVRQLQTAIAEQRTRLAAHLAAEMRSELFASRRQWETRLLGKVASRWGFSPFSLVLRVFQGLGGLLSGAFLLRARTPAQVALWGALESARWLRKHRSGRQAEQGLDRVATACWGQGDLREAALVIEGYTADACLPHDAAAMKTLAAEAGETARAFVTRAAADLESLLSRAAERHSGWLTRSRYEILLAVVLILILYRPARNFFYDSWLGSPPQPIYGLEFYLLSAFWLLVWCGVLLWAFASRLRRGFRRQLDELAVEWQNPQCVQGLFWRLESECQRVERFRQELENLHQQVAGLRHRLSLPDEQLGSRLTLGAG